MLPALNNIAASQYKPSLHTKFAIDILINCVQIYPNSNIRYHARNMILYVESDATYLFRPGALSSISGKKCLRGHPTNPTKPSDVKPNGPIIMEY